MSFAPLSVLHIKSGAWRQKLTQGISVLCSLRLDRSVIGDILVNDKGADMIGKFGYSGFSIIRISRYRSYKSPDYSLRYGELEVPEQRLERHTFFIRLDNVVSTAFHVSRASGEAIKEASFCKSRKESHQDKRVERRGCDSAPLE